MPKKKGKFYICILWIIDSYNTLKSHKKDAHTRLRILILKLQENSPRYHADLFTSRPTYNIFRFNYSICRFFSSVFYFVFCSPRPFYIFHLGKLLLALNTLNVIPVNLIFFQV